MKFDVNILRYIEKDAWRVLVSVEMGMKNHELVPVELVNAISGLKHGGAYKYVRELLKHKLVHHENQKYDGYRLTPSGTTSSPSKPSSTAAPSPASAAASASAKSLTCTRSSRPRARRSP